jgi:hypothetical protein
MYKLVKIYEMDGSSKEGSVLRSDGWSIPFDPANTDYQEYLKWVAAGNEPLPADE